MRFRFQGVRINVSRQCIEVRPESPSSCAYFSSSRTNWDRADILYRELNQLTQGNLRRLRPSTYVHAALTLTRHCWQYSLSHHRHWWFGPTRDMSTSSASLCIATAAASYCRLFRIVAVATTMCAICKARSGKSVNVIYTHLLHVRYTRQIATLN